MQDSLDFPCPRCGAALPVDPTAPSVTCSYCGAVAPVPPAIREQAIAHAARVGEARGKADVAHQTLETSAWATAYYKNWWKVPAFFFGGLITLWISAMALRRAGVPEAVMSWGSFALFIGVAALFISIYQGYRSRQK